MIVPKISVIVPVYNTAKFLDRCIESILNQSYDNFELILINDGSTDNSVEIIKKFEKQDKRIIFINNNNNGVSETRNIGLRNAKGEYIQFVDSDDYINEDMLIDTLKLLEKNKSDLVITGLYLDIEKDNRVNTSIQTYDYKESTNKREIAVDVLNRLDGTYINSPINKLYKRSIIIENNIFMDKSIDLGEDYIFNIMYLKYCQKVIFSDKCYYHYWMKIENNLTFRFRENKLDLMRLMYEKTADYFKESGLEKREYSGLNNIYVKWMYSSFIDLNNKGCNFNYKEKIDYLKQEISKNKYIIKETTDLNMTLKVLKYALNYPNIVLIISKVIYIIKVKYRSILYK